MNSTAATPIKNYRFIPQQQRHAGNETHVMKVVLVLQFFLLHLLAASTHAQAPQINTGGVVNAASFAAAPVAPGAIVSIFGTNLATTTIVANSRPLPLNINGTQAAINGFPVPLISVSPSQINAQMPWEVAGVTQGSLTVTVQGQTSPAQVVSLAPFGPGAFTLNQRGTGQAAIVDGSGLIVDASNPAIAGSTSIQIYSTGLGPVTNQPASGSAAPSNPLAVSTTTPIVTIGGIPAPVLFSGLAPEFIGLYQVNAQVPAAVAGGNSVPVVISIGGVTLNTVTIAVRSSAANATPRTSAFFLPFPEGNYQSAQEFKGTRYNDSLFHLGKDYCVEGAKANGNSLTGVPFYSIASGNVVASRFSEPSFRDDGVGNYLVIDHGNGVVAVYMHLAKIYVTGGSVTSETVLGEAGDVILHPQPNCAHLHVEIRGSGSTSLNVPPNLRYPYVSRDGVTKLTTPLGGEPGVLAWIDQNFLDPDTLLQRRSNVSIPVVPTIGGFSWSPAVPIAGQTFSGMISGAGFVVRGTRVFFCGAGSSNCVEHPSAGVTANNTNLTLTNVNLRGSGPYDFYVQTNAGRSGRSSTFTVSQPLTRDDYPYKAESPNAADPYNFYYRECTSFAAWRMNRDAGATDPTNPSFTNRMRGGHWGNENYLDENAEYLGYRYDSIPTLGSIAHWNEYECNNGGGRCASSVGHVAYVEAVNSDGSVNVSEYNFRPTLPATIPVQPSASLSWDLHRDTARLDQRSHCSDQLQRHGRFQHLGQPIKSVGESRILDQLHGDVQQHRRLQRRGNAACTELAVGRDDWLVVSIFSYGTFGWIGAGHLHNQHLVEHANRHHQQHCAGRQERLAPAWGKHGQPDHSIAGVPSF